MIMPKNASSNTELPHYKPGDIVNDYELLKNLGGREDSSTFSAKRVGDRGLLVIKIFHKHSENAKKLFENELKAYELTKNIQGALHIIDTGKIRDDDYLVTEFISGGTLRDVFDEHLPDGLSIPKILQIFTPLAKALDELHKLDIVYRDLKPENILVRLSEHDNYEIFIVDFGLSKFIGPAKSFSTETLSGTNPYFAPEDWNPHTKKTSALDIYKFGILLYEAFEGKVPFKDSRDALMNSLPYPDSAYQQTDAITVDYLIRALQRDPEQRPRTASEIIAGFRRTYNEQTNGNKSWAGKQFGYYIVEETLGKGNNSISLKAKHSVTNEIVVLKVYRNVDEDCHHAFETEINALGKLEKDHGILIPQESFEHDGFLVLVTEFKDGGNFRHLINKTLREDVEKILSVFMQIAEAIDYIHKNNIVHRDIKPENIVFTKEGDDIRIFLTDFGCAKILAGSQKSFDTVHVSGTYRYMAPEAWKPQSHQSSAVDIYAFGIMLYETLEGHAPFESEFPAISEQHLHETVPDPKQALSKVGHKAINLIKKSLSKNPDLRPKSAVTLIEEIKKTKIDQDTKITQRGVILQPLNINHPRRKGKREMMIGAMTIMLLFALICTSSAYGKKLLQMIVGYSSPTSITATEVVATGIDFLSKTHIPAATYTFSANTSTLTPALDQTPIATKAEITTTTVPTKPTNTRQPTWTPTSDTPMSTWTLIPTLKYTPTGTSTATKTLTDTLTITPTNTPTNTPCPTPSMPVLTGGRTGGTVNLSWNMITGAISYQVIRSTDGGQSYSPLGLPILALTTTDTIPPKTTYWYKIVVDHLCGSNESTPISVPRP